MCGRQNKRYFLFFGSKIFSGSDIHVLYVIANLVYLLNKNKIKIEDIFMLFLDLWKEIALKNI